MPYPTPKVDPALEQGLLERALTKRGWKVTLNHLEQAVDNSSKGHWEAANGQVRSFLESLFNDVAAALHKGDGNPLKAGEARKYLQQILYCRRRSLGEGPV